MAPRWLVRLLERVLPEDRHDDLVGDLEELHRRRLDRLGTIAAHLLTLAESAWLLFRFGVGRPVDALFSGRWVSAIELRLALRLVVKQPVMTLTSVVALGVGIGIVAGGFSVFRQALASELPWANGDRWVTVETYDRETRRRAPLELERFRLLRTSAPALAYLGGTESGEFNVVHGNGEVERISGARVTPGLFRHLPYRPVLGRLFVAADGAPDAEPVALVRESLWERRFGRSHDMLGRPLRVAGTDHLIVGVLPDEAGYPSQGELWLPMKEAGFGATDDRSPVGARFVGLLAEGATVEQARSQVQQLSDRASSEQQGLEGRILDVAPLGEMSMSPGIQVGIVVFMTVLLAILLIIAANVANLVVARTSRRSAELAVRTALGASRRRLVGQLFLEMLLVGGLASLLGLAAAGLILEVYDTLLDELPFWVDLSLRPSTAAVVAFLAVLATTVTGVVPGLRATGKDPGDALRGAGRGASLTVGRIGGAMIAAEVALSVALLGAAVLFARGFQRYLDPAFDLPEERVLTARLTLDLDEGDLVEGGASTVSDSLELVFKAVRRSVASMPEVPAVGLTSHLPRNSPYPEPVEVEGSEEVVTVPLVAAGPGLFGVLGVEPLLGRVIERTDLEPNAPAVAVVNRSFALQRFGTTRVVGRRLRPVAHDAEADPGPWREIVGVVPDVMEVTGAAGGAAGIYLPFEPRRFVSLAVRVAGEPMALTGRLRRAAYGVEPGLNVSEVVRLDQVGAENRRALGVMSTGLTGIGLVTLLLSLAGVYSIVSLSVTRRTREIGVRVALGAERSRVLWSVLRRSALLVLAGATLGAVAGHHLVRIRLFVFAVPDGGWWLFPGLVVLMAGAGLLACWLPARRALSIEPVEALRHDA